MPYKKSTFLVLLSTLLASVAANGQMLDKPVQLYPIDCANTFACPTSLFPRVSFWVEVFSRWDTNTAIFHDKENPHRVYSTIKRSEGCRKSRTGDAIDKERKHLQKKLTATAKRLQRGSSLSNSQKRLASLFQTKVGDGLLADQMLAAADRIRCQSGNRDRMQMALSKFQLYRPTILDALEKQNLTPELLYLPFVESAFNPDALSHVGAAGLWQIIPQTGRTLGLTINNVVDERYDPSLATYAAALYFRNSVDDLSETAIENGYQVSAQELNPFVITSYNYGVKGMERAIKQVGLNYERLLTEYKSPNFQTAVKNFYASFLAARHVAKNAQQFFGDIEYDPLQRHYSFNRIQLKRGTSVKRLIQYLNIEKATLKQLNPSLKNVVWKNKALVPNGFSLKLPYREQGWESAMVTIYSLPKEIERPGFFLHRVRKGQTACGIARQYRASCRELIKLNRLDKRATIYQGKSIKVPTNTGGITVAGNTTTKIGSSNSALAKYRVRPRDTAGQTACGIAQRYRLSCKRILTENNLTLSSTIRVGQRLRLPSR